ncbi:MAG: glycosyltransferase family 4 protein [Bacteroidetes bacterium]|nr:glycosyltransferase family 4 protein [Bacteroidota bacterium]
MLKNRLEGIGLFAHEVLRRLVTQHPEHEFVFFFDRPFDPDFVFGKNVTPIVLFPPARHPFLFIWWFEWSVARALKKYRADVFLSPDNFLSLRTEVKTVLVTHDLAHVHFPEQLPFFQRKYYRFFAPKFNRRANGIVTVSEFTKNDIVAQYDVPPDKISVACNGCREIFQPLETPEKQAVRDKFTEGKPYFYYIGAVHPRKNVHRLIAAFDQFKTTTGAPHQLLIAGRFAWQAGEVRDAFRAAKHQPDIRFLGYVNDDDAACLMGATFACTYVSLFEGFGVPVLEAMHCEVPVITSNVSSLPEVAGDAALLVDPTSVPEIAEAMRRLWQDEHLCQKLVTNGRLQRQRSSWQKAADVVYDSLLDCRSAASIKTSTHGTF